MASVLTETWVSTVPFGELESSSLENENLAGLAAVYLTLPAVSKVIPAAALSQALQFRKQKMSEPKENAQVNTAAGQARLIMIA